jgi:CTP synthase
MMDSQRQITDMGGTMRLGAYPCRLTPGSRVQAIYGTSEISERHRHRYEVNNDYRDVLEQEGFLFSGLSPDGNLVEMGELPNHPWYVGCQFHPELKSRPMRAHPLFAAFVRAAMERRDTMARATDAVQRAEPTEAPAPRPGERAEPATAAPSAAVGGDGAARTEPGPDATRRPSNGASAPGVPASPAG